MFESSRSKGEIFEIDGARFFAVLTSFVHTFAFICRYFDICSFDIFFSTSEERIYWIAFVVISL